MRQAFGRGFWLGSALAGMMTATKGHASAGGRCARSATPSSELVRSGRAAQYPKPDGTLTFDKLSCVFLSGNRTRDDAADHLRVRHHVPRDLAELWERMCPAQVYELGRDVGERRRRARGDALELRPVRRDHREGRPADAARGRLRARVHALRSVIAEQR